MSRRTLRVLGLTLIIAVFTSAFVANADARTHKLSKAQKHAISKKLMRAVKKNPRVISKRWFLKKASLVSFSLPSTIRLDPVVDQAGNIAGDPQSRAFLNLGPSLGQRTIPLSGSLHANINFNDAFDGGHLGDVRITLPPDPSATLKTTAVPLLTNPNVTETNTKAPQDEIDSFALVGLTGSTSGNYTLKVGSPSLGTTTAGALDWGAAENLCATTAWNGVDQTIASTPAQACLSVAHEIRNAIGPLVGGTRNVYVAVLPLAVAKSSNTGTLGKIAVNTVFVGQRNEQVIGGIDGIAPGPPGTAVANGGPTVLLAYAFDTNLDLVPDSVIQTAAQGHTVDAQGMGGCGSWVGNGAAASPATSPLDVDLPNQIKPLNTTGNNDYVGSTAVSPDPDASEQDVVLRTSALQLNIAAPNTVEIPGDNEDNPGSSLVAPYTAGTQISVVASDAAAFYPGQTLTITDGFNSDTAKIGPNSADVGNGGLIQLSATPGADNTLITSPNDYATGSIVSVTGTGTVQKSVGSSGGRANLFGQPINGLARGNSVDVTVNLATDIHSIARQVDAATPEPFGGPSATSAVVALTVVPVGASSIAVAPGSGPLFSPGELTIVSTTGTKKATITSVVGDTLNITTTSAFTIPAGGPVSESPEVNGNINAYSDCRQAWTGSIRNYLTGIKLVGSLRISPAITADGKVRIAKVNLRTPQPVPEALAACLSPYQLYMQGVDMAGDPFFPKTAPQLVAGAEFNPLLVLAGSSHGESPKPNAVCNQTGGPLDRSPFNMFHNGGTTLSELLTHGAAVGVAGTIATTIKAEVLVGNYTF